MRGIITHSDGKMVPPTGPGQDGGSVWMTQETTVLLGQTDRHALPDDATFPAMPRARRRY